TGRQSSRTPSGQIWLCRSASRGRSEATRSGGGVRFPNVRPEQRPATIDDDGLTANPSGFVAAEKRHDARDIVGHSHASRGKLVNRGLLDLVVVAEGFQRVGFYRSGGD